MDAEVGCDGRMTDPTSLYRRRANRTTECWYPMPSRSAPTKYGIRRNYDLRFTGKIAMQINKRDFLMGTGFLGMAGLVGVAPPSSLEKTGAQTASVFNVARFRRQR